MNVLAFAGAGAGERMCRFLLEEPSGARFRFVLTPAVSAALEAFLVARGAHVERYDAAVVQSIVAAGERYAWLLNLMSPHLLPDALVALADHSLVVHNSIVPHARGRDAVSWTIRERAPAGASLLEIAPAVDGGRVWHQRRVPYDYPLPAFRLVPLVEQACVDAFIEAWPALRAQPPEPSAQLDGGSLHRRSETIRDKHIDADADPAAADLINRLLAHDVSVEHTAIVRLDGRDYRARITLEPFVEGG